ncbi:Lrp/AsnC family transcriptional regulator [Arenibaculum sp.]|jgi:Lrp/AsnC family transcriptional regulator|uniref:Lrp/AsnC family transcriptional regulator n=1 Tax=Arenibaculum sp. TaxID=2865862 RepID=UPI002E0F717D|nr:Lrp/AsnC family transcriptional regulator [Arenibaculum sp.]
MKLAIDAFDRKIIRIIQAEPDIAIHALAERVGLSHTPCWRRLKKLEEGGVIKGRAVLLDADALGLPIAVFAHIRMKAHDEDTLESFEEAARSRPEIVECFSMSGEADFLLRIVMASVADYEIFLKKVLVHMPGVGSVNSSFALKCVKFTTMLPV